MISLIDFENLKFFEDNPKFLKNVNDSRYKDTIYSIVKIMSKWVVYIIDDDKMLVLVKQSIFWQHRMYPL